MAVLECTTCGSRWGETGFEVTDPTCWYCETQTGVPVGAPRRELCETCGGLITEASAPHCRPRPPSWVQSVREWKARRDRQETVLDEPFVPSWRTV